MSSDRSIHPDVERYLKRFDEESSKLPRRERDELREQIEQHLAEAIPDSADDATVRQALDRLGEPSEIVANADGRADARADARAEGRSGSIKYEMLVLVTLAVGGFFLMILGWLAGVILLWGSDVWSRRDKWLGTAALPVGIAIAASIELFATGGDSNLGPIEVLVLSSLFSIGTALYLAARLIRLRG